MLGLSCLIYLRSECEATVRLFLRKVSVRESSPGRMQELLREWQREVQRGQKKELERESLGLPCSHHCCLRIKKASEEIARSSGVPHF